MERIFESGDLVIIKSGSTVMTVTGYEGGTTDTTVVYFNQVNGAVVREQFAQHELKLAYGRAEVPASAATLRKTGVNSKATSTL